MAISPDKILNTRFGKELRNCMMEFDGYLQRFKYGDHSEEVLKGVAENEAKWNIFRSAIHQFMGFDCRLYRDRESIDICTDEELVFRFKRKEIRW